MARVGRSRFEALREEQNIHNTNAATVLHPSSSRASSAQERPSSHLLVLSCPVQQCCTYVPTYVPYVLYCTVHRYRTIRSAEERTRRAETSPLPTRRVVSCPVQYVYSNRHSKGLTAHHAQQASRSQGPGPRSLGRARYRIVLYSTERTQIQCSAVQYTSAGEAVCTVPYRTCCRRCCDAAMLRPASAERGAASRLRLRSLSPAGSTRLVVLSRWQAGSVGRSVDDPFLRRAVLHCTAL